MNSIIGKIAESPFNMDDLCAYVIITDENTPYNLNNVMNASYEHTFTCWIKSVAPGRITVENNSIETDDTWKKFESTFVSNSTDLSIWLDVGTYYIYHSKLELGNKPTDYTEAPEDTDWAYIDQETGLPVIDNSTQKKVISGYLIAGHTISGDKIIAKSLTANEIDVADLFAQNITATGTITGMKLIGGSVQSLNYLEDQNGDVLIGSKIDLENGAIKSKSFNIDNNGNAAFTGEIKADSGMIGDGISSFFLIKDNGIYGYKVDMVDRVALELDSKYLVNSERNITDIYKHNNLFVKMKFSNDKSVETLSLTGTKQTINTSSELELYVPKEFINAWDSNKVVIYSDGADDAGSVNSCWDYFKNIGLWDGAKYKYFKGFALFEDYDEEPFIPEYIEWSVSPVLDPDTHPEDSLLANKINTKTQIPKHNETEITPEMFKTNNAVLGKWKFDEDGMSWVSHQTGEHTFRAEFDDDGIHTENNVQNSDGTRDYYVLNFTTKKGVGVLREKDRVGDNKKTNRAEYYYNHIYFRDEKGKRNNYVRIMCDGDEFENNASAFEYIGDNGSNVKIGKNGTGDIETTGNIYSSDRIKRSYIINQEITITDPGANAFSFVTPDDYHEFIGYVIERCWPLQTWNGAFCVVSDISPGAAGETGTIALHSPTLQNYQVRIAMIYR